MTFDLTEQEWLKVKRWYKTKHKKCHNTSSKSGYKFVIISTGIGNVIKAKCRDCKEDDLDLTDYGTW